MKSNAANYIIGFLVFILIIIFGTIAILFYQQSQLGTKTIDFDTLTAKFQYQNNGMWNYSITGTKPADCVIVQVTNRYLQAENTYEIMISYLPPEDTSKCSLDSPAPVNETGDFMGDLNTKFAIELRQSAIADLALPKTDITIEPTQSVENGGFKLDGFFSEGVWNLQITGSTLTPCAQGIPSPIYDSLTKQLKVNFEVVSSTPDCGETKPTKIDTSLNFEAPEDVILVLEVR